MLTECKSEYKHYYVDEYNRKQGKYTSWNGNGTLSCRCFYLNDLLHGEYKDWFNNGQIWEESFFVNNIRHGEFKYWNTNGTLDTHCFFINGERVTFEQIPYPETEEDRMYFTLKYNLPLLSVEP